MSELSKENNIEGPIHYIDISVPVDVLWPKDKFQSKYLSLFEYLRSVDDPKVSDIFLVDDDDMSVDFAFRGFVKKDGEFLEDWQNRRYNFKISEENLNQYGHDILVREGVEGDELFTSRYLRTSLAFAHPHNEAEIGYLVLYANPDKLFHPEKDFKGKIKSEKIFDIENDSALRDRLDRIILLKPEIKRSGIGEQVARIKRILFGGKGK